MSNFPSSIKVKKLAKTMLGEQVPKQKRGDEGNTGRYYHSVMGVGSTKGVDVDKLNLEMKTRKRGSAAPHTTGSMTYTDIINTPWKDTLFAAKRQRVHEAIHDDTFTGKNEIVHESIIDMTKPEIQNLLERDYEIARAMLKNAGSTATGTIVGGEFGILEHKGSNSWAHRIPNSGYKKIKRIAASMFDKLFEFE